eukprot:UN28775
MTIIYLVDDYAYWWRPFMWGCYIGDLIMLLSKWNYFKASWLKFVFVHHFGVGFMLLVLTHTTQILTPTLLLTIIIFMNSNTPGCFSPLWKIFKLPFCEWSTLICFACQRAMRITSYALSYRIDSILFVKKDYNY